MAKPNNKKTIVEKIEELYSAKPEPLAGVIELRKLQEFLISTVSQLGLSPKSQEGKLYNKALEKIQEAYDLLERSSEDGVDFNSPQVQNLVPKAKEYILDNFDTDPAGCKTCKKLIIDANQPISAPKAKTDDKDAKILEVVAQAVKWSPEGENGKTLQEKLKLAYADPSNELVKTKIGNTGKKTAAVFVDGKGINIVSAALASGRALKAACEGDSCKYKKVGNRYIML